MELMRLPKNPDYTAPDGSEIRLLPGGRDAGLAHCTLPTGRTSKAVRHKTVEEIWYFVQGEGQVWRKYGSTAQVTDVQAGTALKIPYQAHFQFRNTGRKDLVFMIVTSPAWPGPEEAIEVKDYWPVRRRK